MRKHDSRTKVVPAAGPTPMLILAGLPRSIVDPAAATIRRNYNWQVVASPFEERETLYSSKRALCDLMIQVCGFAKKQSERNEQRIPAPSWIVLAYVRDGMWQHLLDAFGYSVMACAIDVEDWEYPRGLHWRFSIETVISQIQSLLDDLKDGPIKDIKRRVEGRSSSEPLILPARNFHLSKEDRLATLFDDLLSGSISLDRIDSQLKPQKFVFDRFATYYSKMGGRDKRYHVDARDLVFPHSNSGQHGGFREMEVNQTTTIEELRRGLETAYRFGTPLPQGFQHDVQYEAGRKLVNETFSCVLKGEVPVSGTHANVYPNDSVREP